VKYKLGDKIKILDTKNMQTWYRGRAIGREFTITKEDMEGYKRDKMFTFNDNECLTNFKPEDIELVSKRNTWKGGKR